MNREQDGLTKLRRVAEAERHHKIDKTIRRAVRKFRAPDHQDFEDLVQHAWMHVLKEGHQDDGRVFRCAWTRVRDYLRNTEAEPLWNEDILSHSDVTEKRYLDERTSRLLESLKGQDREIAEAILDGETRPQIAARLSVSRQTVWRRLRSVLRFLESRALESTGT